MKPPRVRRFSLTRHKWSLWALPAFGLFLIAGMWAAMGLQLRSTERTLVAQVTRDTESVATEFEQYTRRVIKGADQTTLLIKHEFEAHDTVDLAGLIRAGLIESSGLEVISVADAKGDVIARSQPAMRVNIADRDYFQRHAARDTGLVNVSKPVSSHATKRTQILISRRINRRDGTFAGVALVSVTPEYFTEFYDEGDLGKLGSLSVIGTDGTLRARRVGSVVTTVSDAGEPQLIARAATNPVGNYGERNESGRVEQIVAYRQLADYPLIVTAARVQDEALTGFYRSRTIYNVIAATVTAAILAFFAIITVLAVRLQRHRGELKVQRRFLETLFDNVPSGITVRSMQPGTAGQFILWNESNSLMFGTKAEEALGKTVQDVMPAQFAEDVLELDRQLLASPMVQDIAQERGVPGKGQRIYHLIRAPIFGAQGQVDYIMSSATDITEERARTAELQLASKVFETTADAIVISDVNDRVVMVNVAFTKLTGYEPKDMVGEIFAETPFRPIDVAESNARMELQQRFGSVTGEVPRFRKDGTPLALWVTASMVRNVDGTIRNYVRVFTDISLLKETQKKLEQLASIDTLTGLPNRRLLLDRLEQAVLRAQRSNQGLAVMFIDLDGFKKVNDSLGHDAGDLVLREAALRLSKCIRLSDSVARLGGDEFAVVLENAQIPADAAHVGERIVAALALPFVIDGQLITIAASIGIAIYPNDGTDGATLLKNADAAMYGAKQAGRHRFKFFSPTAEDPVGVA